ncbi:MAG: pteridine reductase [Granulosicoccus sp.]|nr:pteridine reductase [Granulosicoccus sp.]
MNQTVTNTPSRVAIVTGAARRIGSVTASTLHARGMNVVIHYGRSKTDAEAIVRQLNSVRANSATAIAADLADDRAAHQIVDAALSLWGRLDVLVNNASTFYPTPLETLTVDETARQIDTLFASNYRAPLLLAQAATESLAETRGCIVNMIDIHAYRPYPSHLIYGTAKAALLMQTRALALELAPNIRVNGVAPGSILWPEGESAMSEKEQENVLRGIPLRRNGTPDDIANMIAFLVSNEANYITGQIISVDGGRSL